MKKQLVCLGILMMSLNVHAELTTTCEKFFKQNNEFFQDESNKELFKDKVEKIKTEMAKAKEEMAQMPAEEQDLKCTKGISSINKVSDIVKNAKNKK